MRPCENQTARWLDRQLMSEQLVAVDLGSLVAAASAWTEDERELDDLVSGLVESGRLDLRLV